jgi:hypothetical protein
VVGQHVFDHDERLHEQIDHQFQLVHLQQFHLRFRRLLLDRDDDHLE